MDNIYLWGPKGAGKTWLLNALIRHINLMESALSRNASPFDLYIDDFLGKRATCTELVQNPTTDIEYVTYTLKREYKDTNNSKKSEYIQMACTHEHTISMLDGPGDETTGRILVAAPSEENRAKVQAAQKALKNAKYLLIVIFGGPEGSETKNSINTVGKNFSEDLKRLINLDRDSRQKTYLCFTKADKYQKGNASEVTAILPFLFGKYANEIEAQLRDIVQFRKGEIPAHFISATGYFYEPVTGKLSPNFDNASNTLLDPTNWRPHNVCNPFFDIFDDSEKNIIMNMPIDYPIRASWTPIQPLIQSINKTIVDAHRNDILGSYRSYHEMVPLNELHT